MSGPGASKRYVITLLTGCVLFVYLFISSFRNQDIGTRRPDHAFLQAQGPAVAKQLTGHSIMPTLGNETAKAELGRATWKYFHTVMARFPDHPTADESAALQSYIHLFQRLYPCGECAEHFRQILNKFPPQTSSRSAAAAWACHVHNEVNKSLEKEIFDCSNIGDFYDCGCADNEDTEGRKQAVIDSERGGKEVGAKMRNPGSGKREMSAERTEKLTGSSGRNVNTDLLKEEHWLKLEKEG